MGVSLGWLAVALVASGPAAPTQEAGPRITYRFQTVEVKGLSWREADLRPVAQHGSVSVWTTPDDFLHRVAEAGALAEADAATEAEGAAGAPVHVTARKPREFVTRVVWKGKGRAPKPVVEHVREGLTATVVGRRLDQGVLAQIVVEDVDVRAVHTIATATAAGKQASAEASAPKCPFEAMKAKERGDASVTVTVTASMDADDRPQIDAAPGWQVGKPTPCKADEHATRAGWTVGDPVRIPEVGRASAAGEWLIPEGEVLVVGFGPHTVADADGKAVTRERLAVIAVEPADDAEAPTPLAPEIHEIPPPAAPVRTDAPRTAAALPKLPERTLPQPIHPDGTPAPMPTVPEDEAHAAEAAADSAETRPTPQSRRKTEPKDAVPETPETPEPNEAEAPKVEPGLIKSSFALPALEKIAGLDSLSGLISANLFGGPFQSVQILVPLKPLALKLPFNRRLEFELIGRVVADPEVVVPFVAGN